MTLYEFNALDELEQLQAVSNGSLLDFRKEGIYVINLYQLDGFYVEEYIHRETQSRHKYRSFSNTDQLDVYTRQIDIDNLLEGK